MSLHEKINKGNKKILILRKEAIDNPILTSLFTTDYYVYSCFYVCGWWRCNFRTNGNTLYENFYSKGRDGVSLDIGIFLFFLARKLIPVSR